MTKKNAQSKKSNNKSSEPRLSSDGSKFFGKTVIEAPPEGYMSSAEIVAGLGRGGVLRAKDVPEYVDRVYVRSDKGSPMPRLFLSRTGVALWMRNRREAGHPWFDVLGDAAPTPAPTPDRKTSSSDLMKIAIYRAERDAAMHALDNILKYMTKDDSIKCQTPTDYEKEILGAIRSTLAHEARSLEELLRSSENEVCRLREQRELMFDLLLDAHDALTESDDE